MEDGMTGVEATDAKGSAAIDWNALPHVQPHPYYPSDSPVDKHGRALHEEWDRIAKEVINLAPLQQWVAEARRHARNPRMVGVPVRMPWVTFTCPKKRHAIARVRGLLRIQVGPDGNEIVRLELDRRDMSAEYLEAMPVEPGSWIKLNPRIPDCGKCEWKGGGMRFTTMGKRYLETVFSGRDKCSIEGGIAK
ncbi:hypothetical protein ABH924_000152 [Arthrobacter sp. GAS37]